MSNNLSTFDNPYAAMAQGAYPNTPEPFPIEALEPNQQQVLNNNNSIPFDFSKSVKAGKNTYPGGRHYSDNPSATNHPDWPKNGVVYLQPDPTLRSVPRTTDLTLPQMNGGYQSTPHTTVGHYQKGLLTDEPAGFNAYFATEIKKITVRAKGLIFLCPNFVLVV